MTSRRKPSAARLIVGVIMTLALALLLVAVLVASDTAAWLEAAGAIVLLVVSYWLSFWSRDELVYRRVREHDVDG